MNANQKDQLSMEKVVDSFLIQTTPEILAQMPEIEMLKNVFSENINKIDILFNGQNLNRTGTRMTKEEYREEMTKRAFSIAARVCSYAIANSDEELQMKVTYVYSYFTELRDIVVANVCKNIYDIASPLLGNLANYGVTEDSMQKLKDTIELYRLIQPKTRSGIVKKTTFTHRIQELFAKNNKLLFKIDRLVIMLRFDEANFFNEYFNSRKIVDTGHRKLSLRGKITNEMGQPIDKVYITVETSNPETVKSTALGNYQFKGIPAGVWPVTFKRDGFITEKIFLVFTPTLRVDYNTTLKAADEHQRIA